MPEHIRPNIMCTLMDVGMPSFISSREMPITNQAAPAEEQSILFMSLFNY